MKRVIFNGKFLAAPPTGVQRVATQLLGAFRALAGEGRVPDFLLRCELLAPPGAPEPEALGWPGRTTGRLTGSAWEQVSLPRAAGDATIVNLCNVGPLFHPASITMIHDAQVYTNPSSYSRAFRSWYRFQQPVCGRLHRRILTVSEFSRSELVRYGIAPAEKIAVLHNGVDHFLAVTPDRSILSRTALERPFCLALANTQPHKNIRLLLRAFDNPRLSGLTLALVGAADADDFARSGHRVPPNVVFLGRVSDPQLRSLYEASVALLFPSLTEGFGLPPLEAMAVGCPAVVAPEGALPETCGQAAQYADGGDPRAWIDEILRLASDEAHRQQAIERGFVQASRFTWRAAAERLLEEVARVSGWEVKANGAGVSGCPS